MARPQRNTVDYFPHLIGDGKKMFFIEQKYGNDGYATWFKILECLASTENHFLNLNDEQDLMFTAAKCRVSEETLLSIICDLTKLKVFDSELWEFRVVWCQIFIDSIQDAYSKRSNECQTYEGLREHLASLGVLKGDVKPQSKVKETKEEKNKPEIPPFKDFKIYALTHKPNVNIESLHLKYEAWREAGWMCGKPLRKIKNWKATLLNTLAYLKENQVKTFETNRD